MTKLDDTKRLMMDLIAAYYSLDKSIPELSARAQMFIDQDVRRRELEDQIHELEASIDPLAAEIAALKPLWTDATFDQDERGMKRIQERRRKLEAEIVGVQREVEELQRQLDADPVDMAGLVELKATVDGHEVPNAYDFTRDLTAPLQAVESDLVRRIGEVQRSLVGIDIDPDQVEAYKLEHNAKHKARKASEELQGRKHRAAAERRGQRYQAVLRSNAREAEIAGARADDRISATVGDSRLSDEVDE